MEEVRTEGRKFIPPFFIEYFSANDLNLYDALLMWERIPRKIKKKIKRYNGGKYKEFLDARAAERLRVALNKGGQNFFGEVQKISDYMKRKDI